MNPYIGITDFLNFEQVQGMLQAFNAHRPHGSNRVLHVGVMMSYKTLHGIPSKWSDIFPPKERIAEIFSSDETYNCLHYADYENNPELWRSLGMAISYSGIGIRAIQLDMTWPDPGEVAHGIHASRKQVEVILQVGKDAIEEVGNSPQGVIERLSDYEGVIHRVLLDKSMGMGVGMDATGLIPFVQAIKQQFPELGIVTAGGLGPKTMHLVKPLVDMFPEISIDAQGRLRPSGSILDPIDWAIAGEYLAKAHEIFA